MLIVGGASIGYFYLRPAPIPPVVISPEISPPKTPQPAPKPPPPPVVGPVPSPPPPVVVPAAASGCDGQTGKAIFEDKFTDDLGGWPFGAADGLVFHAPGASITVRPSVGNQYWWRFVLNETFNASEGDFCAEISFPADAPQLRMAAGVAFLAQNNENLWVAEITSSSEVKLRNRVGGNWSDVWSEKVENLVKSGSADVNSVRAVVKQGTIMVIVNGQTVKNVRAAIPSGKLRFGIYAEYTGASATPVAFPVRSYKVTTGDWPNVSSAPPAPANLAVAEPSPNAAKKTVPFPASPPLRSQPDSVTKTVQTGIEHFLGMWVNVDPNTRGVPKLYLSLAGQNVRVHAWGACHPNPCDWGEVGAEKSDNTLLQGIFKPGFAETTFLIRPDGEDRLRVDRTTHFIDNSGRANYSSTDIFQRAK